MPDTHGPYPSMTCNNCNELARRAGYESVADYLQQHSAEVAVRLPERRVA